MRTIADEITGRPPTKKAKKAGRSPSALSTETLTDLGYEVGTVERWIPGANIRKDLFGFIDLMAVHKETGETLAVQATSRTNAASRVKKITDSPLLAMVRKAGWRIEVHGWSKAAGNVWRAKVIDLS